MPFLANAAKTINISNPQAMSLTATLDDAARQEHATHRQPGREQHGCRKQ
jgi:hypothetical protein